MGDRYSEKDILAGESTTLPPRSVEYGSYVIEVLETGRPFKLNGNVTNGGMITNLPADCCGEGPVYVDRTGLHKTIVGDLPPQCAALNLTNINVQRLAVEAALTGDPEHIVHACALDPLTGAVLSLKEIREMASAMLEAEAEWLPQFAGRSIRPTPAISIPKNVKPAEVPVDPALAIMARFQELSR
jgi:alpha-galactosidase